MGLSNYLRVWGGKEKGKAEMDAWEEMREESCKQCMHGEEEEGVRRQGGTEYGCNGGDFKRAGAQ